MLVINLFNLIADILKVLWNSPKPTDKLLSEIFRSKKNIGSKERRFASELIFAILRNKILLDYLINQLENNNLIDKNNNRYLLYIYIFLLLKTIDYDISPEFDPQALIERINQNAKIEEILQSYFGDKNDSLRTYIINQIKIIEEINAGSEKSQYSHYLSIRYSFPEWLLEKIVNKFNDKNKLLNFLKKSTSAANPTIRINTLNTNISEIENELQNLQIQYSKSQIVPNAIILYERVQLSELDFFKSGYAEVQDEGSQLISYILDPQPGEVIMDACAGAGGKALHIAELMNNQGIVIANDIEYNRLKEIPKRAARSAITIIQTNNSLKNNLDDLMNYNRNLCNGFDKILVDAPCSGMGTIRRDPMRKYRINPHLLEKLKVNQLKILSEYSQYLKVGGILVYSTCSLLPDENEWVISEFLASNKNFQPDSLNQILQKNNIGIDNISADTFMLNIDFTQSNSDGFFMARLKRIE